MSRTEELAALRTSLANERTLLAYIRSSVVAFGGGLAGLQFEQLSSLRWLAITFLIIAPIFAGFGWVRFNRTRSVISRIEKD